MKKRRPLLVLWSVVSLPVARNPRAEPHCLCSEFYAVGMTLFSAFHAGEIKLWPLIYSEGLNISYITCLQVYSSVELCSVWKIACSQFHFWRFKARPDPEAESKEKHGAWDPMLELTYNLTLCPLQHIYHGQPYARVDLNLMSEQTLSPVRNCGFSLSALAPMRTTPVNESAELTRASLSSHRRWSSSNWTGTVYE
jgi:hypothetical protein